MKKIIYIVALLFCVLTNAQEQGKIWYFGSNAGLDFNTEPPTELLDGKISTSEGCATLADDSGDLLLYTDGIKVWNKDHQVISNGSGLLGNPSSSQSGIIVPKPGSSTNYYIISVSAYSNSNVYYSEVDLSANSGQGEVLSTVKNIPLLSGTGEMIQATPASNGTDWWIITNKKSTNSYYAFKLSSSGIDVDNPVISSVGIALGSSGDVGYLKFNSANNKMAIAHYLGNKFQVFEWNSSTGSVGSSLLTFTHSRAYGTEFSPNNTYVYVSGSAGIYQFDLSASDVLASAYKVTSTAGYALQAAPNGKIYYAKNSSVLGAIQDPNSLGASSNYTDNSITLSRSSRIGLPNIISSFVSTGPPIVKNLSSNSVETTSATISATVTSDGGETVTERGFYYGTSANPTTNGTTVSGTTGDFSLDITGLTQNTTYYYRAYATNTNGTTTTSDGTFTTSAVPSPTITSFTPQSGEEGNTVTITGTNLKGATSVTFGGTEASITSTTSTTVTVELGSGATGAVVVTTAAGTVSKTGFIFNSSSEKTFFENTVNVTPQLLFSSYTHSTSSTSFSGQTLSLSYSSGGGVEDVLYIKEEGTGAGELNILNQSTKQVRIGDTTIGTLPSSLGGSGVNGETLSITWGANATLEYINKVIKALTYQNNSNTPTRSRDITMSIGDPAGNVTEVITVIVQAENDKHVIGSTNLEVRDITAPGDPVDKMFGSSPGSEQVPNAIDNNTNTKYLNFSQAGSGFTVTPSLGATKVNQFKFTSANDAAGRDPMTFSLYGSNDDGSSFTPIVLGANTNLTTSRFTTSESEVFENTKGYAMYKLIFPTVRSSGANSMQIGEIEFLGIPFQETVFAIGSTAVKVHPKLPIYDAEDDQIASATVKISTSLDPNDVLSWTAVSGITGSYDSSSGILTFTGTASIDTYKTLLRSVKFTTSANSNGKVRDVLFTVTDTDGNQSDATKAKITVSFQPELTDLDHYGTGFNLVENFITYAGIASKTTGLDDNDEEDLPLSFIITSVGSNGSMTKNGSTAGEGTIISSGDVIKWTPSSIGTDIVVFSLKAFDGDLSSEDEYDLTMDVESLPAPTITSFTPTTANVDETVTVTGTNFNSASSVLIGSKTVSYTVVSDTTIRLTVNSNITSGPIKVTTIAGTAVSSDTFTILDEQAPVMASQSFSYVENRSSGYTIGTVSASDNIGVDSFSITSGNSSNYFAIANDGKITLTSTGAGEVPSNDYESGTNTFTLQIEVSDGSSNTTSATVTLIVTNDVNDDTDTDEDGTPDVLDTDDDNDGQLDTHETACGSDPLDATSKSLDTDGDGIPNCVDTDDDGDDTLDVNDDFPLDKDEDTDTDSDGIGNNADTDDDGDGQSDAHETSCGSDPLDATKKSLDTDSDGIPNCVDTDDDGDGQLDTHETSCGSDPLDSSSKSLDTDSDGIPNCVDTDDDGDGTLDVNDAFPLDKDETVDTDGDGIGNNADTDDDGDGQSDANETACGSDPLDATKKSLDSDSDGIPNCVDTDDDNDGVLDINDAFPVNSSESLDTDGDGIGNNADTDDDNDGLSDVDEAAANTNSLKVDTDNDGVIDGTEVTDKTNPLNPCSLVVEHQTESDGMTYWDSLDCDNDGVPNGQEASSTPVNSGSRTTTLYSLDSDGDGILNYLDPDDDGDGVNTIDELMLNSSTGEYTQIDTDGDSTPNYLDVDDDNDGIATVIETNVDTDGDGTPDYLDTDDDGDGIVTVLELSFSDLEDNTTYDSDGDGIPNYLDPVDDYDPSIASLNVDPNTYIYLDTDGDGIVNINDTDDDGDGFLDSVELTCQTNPLRIESQPGDYDSDGIADCIDSDIDGDGVDNIDDLFPMNPFESADNDGDGIGDNIDVDDDNDGVLDSADAFPNDSSEWKDTDNDGIGDYADADFFNDGFADNRQIEVSGLLTPSTTGVESTWKITNINLHPYNVVSVYDKEGKVVFHTQNYKNEWDGSYKDTGNKVPSGSYHYKVHIYDLNQTFTGWLFIAY